MLKTPVAPRPNAAGQGESVHSAAKIASECHSRVVNKSRIFGGSWTAKTERA